jgi:hypothetical protein
MQNNTMNHLLISILKHLQKSISNNDTAQQDSTDDLNDGYIMQLSRYKHVD